MKTRIVLLAVAAALVYPATAVRGQDGCTPCEGTPAPGPRAAQTTKRKPKEKAAEKKRP